MIGKQIILGLAAIVWGVVALYYAKVKPTSEFIKMFVGSGWMGKVLSFCALVSGLIYLVAGIVGWDIWPLR